MFKIIYSTICFLFSYNAVSQFEINYFFASQINSTVKLEWEVKQGSTCSGMQIERSSDSINYSYIGEVTGICGSSSSAIELEYIDNNPKEFSKNYYRLIAGSGETFYQQVFFSYVKESYFFIQNPVTSSSVIYFEGNQSFIVNFYDITGQIMKSTIVSQPAISLLEILGEIPKTLFLLDVQAKNGIHQSQKLIGIQ